VVKLATLVRVLLALQNFETGLGQVGVASGSAHAGDAVMRIAVHVRAVEPDRHPLDDRIRGFGRDEHPAST
jgi:hypothetical protein